MSSITAQTTLKFAVPAALTALITCLGCGWSLASGYESKADKAALLPLQEEISTLKRDREVDRANQSNIIKLLEKMDARMERIENNQVWQIQESVKRWQGNPQPPASTPAPR